MLWCPGRIAESECAGREAVDALAGLEDNGTVLAYFTRVETWGAANVHWVSAEVDPSSPTLFTFRSMIVPANAG